MAPPLPQPRVLVFPYPTVGHIKPFLSLAELLADGGLDVVFLSTEYNHRRIPNLEALASRFPTLHFETISDGLPIDQPHDAVSGELYNSMRGGVKSRLRELIQCYNNEVGCSPITCVVVDVLLSGPIEAAEELGIPVVTFCPYSARYLCTHFVMPQLIEQGQIPFTDGNLVGEIEGVPLFEGLLRRDHLPGFWSVKSLSDELWSHSFLDQTLAVGRTSALIINTFDELEAPFLAHLSSIFPKIFPIGPLNALSKSRLGDPAGFWKEDQACMSWLDSQPPKSVIFVSFGSTMKMEANKLVEFWHGLVNSGKRFLCVLRSDVVHGGDAAEVIKEVGGKWDGIVVAWAAQEKVLAHAAVGGFLTHCGWNSTMESIAAGVPMMCWQIYGDQIINATWIGKVWKIGIERSDDWDRSTVEMTIKELMEGEKGVEIQRSMEKLSKLGNEKVVKGGASFENLELLVQFLKNLKQSH